LQEGIKESNIWHNIYKKCETTENSPKTVTEITSLKGGTM